MISKIRKAVFPAAGLGTRFLPATKAQPKEMLPLVDKPLIQYGVEEAMNSGVPDIIIVTGRGKSAIEDHFDVSFELEHLLETRNKTDLLATVRAVSEIDDGKLREIFETARRLMSAGAALPWAYRRARQPCLRCGARIASGPVGEHGRTAYWCPRCQ